MRRHAGRIHTAMDATVHVATLAKKPNDARRPPSSAPRAHPHHRRVEVGGTLDLDGRWNAPTRVSPPGRYQVIVTQAGNRELSRQEMVDILVGAGYTHSSANGRISSSHPLFHRIGPNRYRLISEQQPDPGSPETS